VLTQHAYSLVGRVENKNVRRLAPINMEYKMNNDKENNRPETRSYRHKRTHRMERFVDRMRAVRPEKRATLLGYRRMLAVAAWHSEYVTDTKVIAELLARQELPAKFEHLRERIDIPGEISPWVSNVGQRTGKAWSQETMFQDMTNARFWFPSEEPELGFGFKPSISRSEYALFDKPHEPAVIASSELSDELRELDSLMCELRWNGDALDNRSADALMEAAQLVTKAKESVRARFNLQMPKES
jgi:hypothetical protein